LALEPKDDDDPHPSQEKHNDIEQQGLSVLVINGQPTVRATVGDMVSPTPKHRHSN